MVAQTLRDEPLPEPVRAAAATVNRHHAWFAAWPLAGTFYGVALALATSRRLRERPVSTLFDADGLDVLAALSACTSVRQYLPVARPGRPPSARPGSCSSPDSDSCPFPAG